jgi:exodeoxyribonuclease VII large subunit
MAVLRPAAVLARQQQGLQRLQARLATAARLPLRDEGMALQRRASRLMAAQAHQLTLVQRRLQLCLSRIQAQDPRAVLSRGYAWVSDAKGRPLTSVSQAAPGHALRAVWHDGSALVRVESVQADQDDKNPRQS